MGLDWLHLAMDCDWHRRPRSYMINVCRIIRRQDRPTALPRHGSTQARPGAAARYQQTVAAGDYAAQAVPSVSPFYPAIRVFAVLPASAALPAPDSRPGVARSFDAIVLTGRERKDAPPSLRPWPAGSPGDCTADAGCNTCILNMNESLSHCLSRC